MGYFDLPILYGGGGGAKSLSGVTLADLTSDRHKTWYDYMTIWGKIFQIYQNSS